MGRSPKKIIKDGLDIREVGYYSTPSFVANFIANKILAINPNGRTALDPAVGKEELLQTLYNHGITIDSFDIVDYKNHNLSNFHHQDFIEFYVDYVSSLEYAMGIDRNLPYDFMICNPPYNCHEVAYIKENKKRLKDFFPIGVHNMYSMFMSSMIKLARTGCVMGFIVSDSFLTATAHSKLRQQILNECSIHSLLLCPNSLFWDENADVRTCIIILQKGKEFQGNIEVLNRPYNIETFRETLENDQFEEVSLREIQLGLGGNGNQFIIDVPNEIINLFHSLPLIGERYSCVTCISTGDDAKYLSSTRKDGFTIPFYKNPASRKFKCNEDCYLIDDYMEESLKVKDFMVRNKPLLGKGGIACSSMGLPFGAVILPKNAVTGVNPTIFPPKEDTYWLLSYLNSSLVTYLVRGILIRSNMVTSGYVKLLPIPNFNKSEKEILSVLSHKAIESEIETQEAIDHIDQVVFSNLKIHSNTISTIKFFSQNLSRSV